MVAINPNLSGFWVAKIMENMSTWEMILLGAIALGVLIWAGPGVKVMLEQSRKAESRDWAGLLLPLLLVVAFVVFLIMMV
jgi:hypothetical protein